MEFKSLSNGISILNLVILITVMPIIFNTTHASSTESIDIHKTQDWKIINVTEIENKTILISNNITITSIGTLSLINVSLKFNGTTHPCPHFRVEAGGKLNMINCQLSACGDNAAQPGLEIFSNQIKIINCTFSDNFVGITFTNISNITLTACTFCENEYGIVLKNCENVSFVNCKIFNNSQTGVSLYNSGMNEDIKIFNGTALKKSSISVSTVFELNNSKLKIINVSYDDSIQLDIKSELIICWYLHLVAINNNKKELSFVDISIEDDKKERVYNFTTDETGHIYWIILPEKNRSLHVEIKYNPFKISAIKKGYSKALLPPQIINSTNSTPQIIKMDKKDKGEETDIRDTLFTVCTCLIIIIVVFITFLALNMYIMRKKVSASGLTQADLGMGGVKPEVTKGGEIITCSECGAQVTGDAKFCPHCGEYFEGEELLCPVCKSIVSENDKICPNCGKVFDTKSHKKGSGTKQTSSTSTTEKDVRKSEKIYCSECGGVVGDKDIRCPGCGLLFNGGIDSLKIHPQNKIKKMKRNINGKIATKVTAKEESKLNKKEDKRHTEEIYMCSICGAEIKGEATKCVKCGTEFE